MSNSDIIDFAGGKKIYSKQAIDNLITPRFDTLPAPVEYPGRTVQYTGETNEYYKKGRFYTSDGHGWAELQVSVSVIVCDALPIWSTAKPETFYYVRNNQACYIKDVEHENEWRSVAGEGKMFVITDTLPTWADANPNKIYMVTAPGSTFVTSWVKNPVVIGEWYKLGQTGNGVTDFNMLDNTPTINGIPTAGMVGSVNDVSLAARVNGQSVAVNDLDLEALGAADVEQVFNEA